MAPVASKSEMFRVTRCRPFCIAVAAIIPSAVCRLCPACWHFAVISPQMRAVATSTGRIRSEKLSWRLLSQCWSSDFFGVNVSKDIPFCISPIVMALRNKFCSGVCRTNPSTPAAGIGFRNSDTAQVSKSSLKGVARA